MNDIDGKPNNWLLFLFLKLFLLCLDRGVVGGRGGYEVQKRQRCCI